MLKEKYYIQITINLIIRDSFIFIFIFHTLKSEIFKSFFSLYLTLVVCPAHAIIIKFI